MYSTEQAIPRKEKPVEKNLQADLRPAQQKVTVRIDRRGRGGKSVTVIEGLQMPQKESEALLKQLKARLGTGGTVKDASLEIQGDHRDAIIIVLEKMGYRPKRSGG
ncbi:MAG: translation initiation factor [Thermodesulfobacteriota bacterium]|nr:translation initiation factor [Thermodesulfobacteriota bacterium]